MFLTGNWDLTILAADLVEIELVETHMEATEVLRPVLTLKEEGNVDPRFWPSTVVEIDPAKENLEV